MSLDDERVRFYFRNREQIEQWAALRSEAAAAVDEWMVQLEPDVALLAHELGTDVTLSAYVGSDQAYPSYRLTRPGWRATGVEERPACVALEWPRARTILRGSNTPYVGVRASKDLAIGTALRASEEVRRVRLARKDASNQWWVAYTYVAPKGEFPTASDAYRGDLIAALRAAWEAYAPLFPLATA